MIDKKNIFRLVLVLIPIFVLVSLELILRLADYGDNLDIVVTVNRNGKNYYTLNQSVGKRYFNEDRLYYRKGSHDFFEVNKKPNTIRVFCFGASTTAGFPYEYNITPSEFLRERMVKAFPNKNIEVINTAIAATNSYTVAEFVNELVHYKPDLFIIYMGQNEFYGAFGTASTISIGKSRWLIKTYLWLQKFKTFLLLKNIISSISNYFSSQTNDKEILMEKMIKNNSIKLNGSDYVTARSSFKDNYEEIIEKTKENKIPIIISTLVSNEKDLPPFVSLSSENLTDSLKDESKMFYRDGVNLERKKDYANAIKYFQKSLNIDTIPANVHFQMGKCYVAINEFNKARKQFITAKNLDGLRFRAPSEFNSIIKQLSYKFNVPLSDVDKEFRENSQHEILGSNLIIDHVHPNIRGYFLLAKTWFHTIKNNNLIGLTPEVSENDSLLWKDASFTPLDSVIGELKILKLKSKPPFNSTEKKIVMNPNNFNEQIAYNYLSGEDNLSWGIAHILAAKKYFSSNDLKDGLKEYKAVLLTDETNPTLLTTVGDIYYKLKLYPKAEESYQKAFLYDDNQFLKYKLGLTNLKLGKPGAAVQYLSSCLIDDKNSKKFTDEEIENIKYNLALAYLQIKDIKNARLLLEQILKNNSYNIEANELLKKLNQKINN